MGKGKLIVFDGIDGSGKSTQIKLLKEDLEASNADFAITGWKDSKYFYNLYIGDLIERIQEGGVPIPPEARTFLLATDLSYRLKAIIQPALEEGKLVICDRHIYKVISQGLARGLERRWLDIMFEFMPHPDMVFIFDTPPSEAYERITKKREPSYFEAGLDMRPDLDKKTGFLWFQQKVREHLLDMTKELDLHLLDGTQGIEAQHDAVLKQLSNCVPHLTCSHK
ncbi:MAG: dTMP kinase [Thermoplasmata archaeon]|nr:dTMP kinase [Thermoplasmata archaeon]